VRARRQETAPAGKPASRPQPASRILRPARLALELGSRSVHGKLLRIVMLTTLAALLIAGIAMLTSDLAVYRRSWASDLTTEAHILALSTAPALAFDDPQVAGRDLSALRVRPGLRVAALYDAKGRLFSQWVAPQEQPPAATLAPSRLGALSGTARIAGERVYVYQPVMQRGEWLGTVYLQAQYSVLGRLQTYIGIFLVVTFGSLLLALVLSRRLQAAITGPLAAMANVARQVIERRDYSLRAEKTTDDEIGIVVDAFNAMLDEVEVRNRALREADQRKDEFLATLAHELRNPLAPIRQATKILDSGRADEHQRRWAGEIIARQVQRMALLLDDLLDVSRITRGRLELRKEPVELATVVSSAVEVARPLIDAKKHTLEMRLPPQTVRVNADPLRLSQALSNLLTNAAKYTDPGGKIVLAAQLTESELRISVEDTGIGVSRQSLPRLFQPFTQLDPAADHSEGGLGIGLALVKGLIELHGGSVEAASAGLGHGTTFAVRLPYAAIAVEESGKGPGLAAQARSAGRCKLLVVDDNRDAAGTLAVLLRMSGHEVSVAHRGDDALKIAAREHPQVFILDIGMPEMSGYELAERIRQRDWGKQALLIALTGWGQPADKQRASAAGFDHHLTKPVDPEELERILTSVGKARSGDRRTGEAAS
jgi:two-component system, sensor histidine kinase